MSEPLVQIDSSDRWITIVTLSRPQKRNALNMELMRALRDAVREAGADVNRRVIVIRANGPSFCAGLDLKEASGGDSDESAKMLAEMYRAVVESPLVTIAAAQGAAVGGGAGLVAACDLTVAADDLKIQYPEVHRGLTAALVTCLLLRQTSERNVRELVLLGQPVDAKTALEMGLVNRVVAGDKLSDTTMELARQACEGAPGAVVRIKRLLDELAARPIADDLARAVSHHVASRDSADAKEGVAAFLEKRKPKWAPREK